MREHPGEHHLLAGLHSLAGNPSPQSEVNAGMYDAEAEYFNVIHSSVITNHHAGLCPRHHQNAALVTELVTVSNVVSSSSLLSTMLSPAPGQRLWRQCPAHWDCHQQAKLKRALFL